MFGIDSSELAVIALVALLVIGPKDLPRAMRWVGQWAGKARAMSRHLRSGFDTMMREAELEEMQKVWAAQNEAIMKATALENPLATPYSDDGWVPPAPESPEIAPPASAAPPPAAADPPAAVPEPPAKRPRRPRKTPAVNADDKPAADAA